MQITRNNENMETGEKQQTVVHKTESNQKGKRVNETGNLRHRNTHGRPSG